MAATPSQTESIRLISDWSKWMATIETGSIAVIGALARDKGAMSACPLELKTFAISIACFILSIWLVALVLASLPAIVKDIPPDESVWDQETTFLRPRLKLWLLTWGQFTLFGLGILAFGTGIVLMMTGC